MHLSRLVDILHGEKCSCVIFSKGEVRVYHNRGVIDLLHLLRTEPDWLKGALVADKVVGRGAAALMIDGGVAAVYADVVSHHALDLSRSACVPVTYGESVPYIINRTATGICPVEQLCIGLVTVAECRRAIEEFIDAKSRVEPVGGQ